MLRDLPEESLFRKTSEFKSLFDNGFTYPNRPLASHNYVKYDLQHVKDPSCFYLEITDATSVDLKASIKDALARYKTALVRFNICPPKVDELWEQMPVVVADATFSEYYRAEIDCINMDKQLVNVTFVDTGEEAIVPPTNIFLPSIDLVRYPKLSLRCRLSQIVPIGSETWPEESYEKYLKGETTSLMSAQNLDRGVYDVYLKCDKADVGIKLVMQLGLAAFIPLKYNELNSGYPTNDFSNWVGVKIPVFSIKLVTLQKAVLQLDAVKVNEVMESIEKYVANTPNADSLPFKKNKGSPCLARFEGQDYYRATILDKPEDGYYVVKYVDYWETDIIPESHIIKIPQELMSIPEGATMCHLLDFADVDPTLEEKLMPVLSELFEYKDLYGRIELIKAGAGRSGANRIEIGLSECVGDEGEAIPFWKMLNLSKGHTLKQEYLSCYPILSNEVAKRLLSGPSDYFPGIKYTGSLSCAETDQSVWLQLGGDGAKAESLAKELTQFYSKWEGPVLTKEMMKIGTYVVCQQEGDDRWYRAKITNYFPDDNLYYILFLDYGNYDYANISSMKPLVDYFGKYKCLALQVALPVILKPDVNMDILSEYMLNFCEDQVLGIWLQHVDYYNYAWIVKDGMSLADELLKNGFATELKFQPCCDLQA